MNFLALTNKYAGKCLVNMDKVFFILRNDEDSEETSRIFFSGDDCDEYIDVQESLYYIEEAISRR